MNELEKRIEELIARKRKIQKQAKSKLKNQKESLTVNKKIDYKEEGIEETRKVEIISYLRQAKTGHTKWLANVQILIQLGNIEEAKVSAPINYTMCEFGTWYYGEGQILAPFKEYIDIDEVHQQIHKTYLQIFGLYTKKLEGSFFKNIKKLEAERKQKAESLYNVLKEYSKLLFDLLILLENRIKKMTDKELDAL